MELNFKKLRCDYIHNTQERKRNAKSAKAGLLQRICSWAARGSFGIGAASMFFGNLAYAEPVGVKLDLEMLRAIKTTKERNLAGTPRDEVYITVHGFTSTGRQIDFRIPSSSITDDYLEFTSGKIAVASNPNSWTNQNQFLVYSPQLYEGVLENEGDTVFLLVMFQEQDNATIGQAQEITQTIFGACENVAKGVGSATKNETAKSIGEVCGYAKKAAGLLPSSDPHELIGAVALQLKNIGNGQVQMVVLPANGDLTGELKAKTSIFGVSDAAVGLVTTSSVTANRVTLDMIDNEGVGRYWATIASQAIDPARVVGGHYRLNNGDIERGTCRGGKSVTVQHPDGVYRSIGVGQAIYMGPDGNRHIEYRCNGSNERERNLFSRPYDKFAVQRTGSKLNYFPYDLIPFEEASIPGRITGGLRNTVDFPVTKGVSRQELRLPVPPSCRELMARDWDRSSTQPIVNFWSPGRLDNSLMSNPSWRSCPGDFESPDYRAFRVEGLVFKSRPTPLLPTVALYHYYNPSTKDNATTRSLWIPGLDRDKQPARGYHLSEIAGYIVAPQVTPTADMEALYTWYDPVRRDYFTTTQANWAGKSADRKDNYIFVRHEGYVLKAE